jgi:anti-sigma factor RsiW
MVSCQDCERYLEAFLDQALDVKENLDMHEHLRACPNCAERAAAERLFRRFIRQHARVPPLPEAVKRRIIHQAITPPIASGWRQGWRFWILPRDFALGMATAVVLLLLWLSGPPFPWFGGNEMARKVVQEASMAYQTYKAHGLPLDVTGSNDQAVVEWFNRRMGYAMQVPCIRDNATKLLGGRLCRIFDRKSATFVYQRNGAELFLFAFRGGLSLPTKPKVRLPNQEVYIQNVAGRPIAVWQHGGIVYSMVGDLTRDDLLHVASTMYYR